MDESSRWPVRPTSAIERGQWVVDELGSWSTIAGIVPPRFAAYARIFHPASGQDLRWRGGNVRGENARTVRWAEVAQHEGTTLHPVAQWESLLGGYRQPQPGQDGWQYGYPGFGRMDVQELAAVARVLARHTATPEDCLATLWEGHGDINGSAIRYFFSDTRSDVAEFDHDSPHHPALHPAMARALDNPRVPLPHRDSLLFELDVRYLVDPSWATASGWTGPYSVDALTPQTLWPDARGWFLASEIDFDSTIVGGSPQLIRDLLALGETGAIEVLELPGGADLTRDGDTINR